MQDTEAVNVAQTRPPVMENIDGLNLPRAQFPLVFKQRIDDHRLKREDDILVATYARTGQESCCCLVIIQ